MSGLNIAFKEWAVICRALASGRQALLLRKGGISEQGGVFRVEHSRFWLYPTYVHQQRDGIIADLADLLRQAEADRPPDGVIRLTHFAEAPTAFRLTRLFQAEALADLHGWSAATVAARFAYREPGLWVLPVRVFAVPEAIDLRETPAYAGCKSWVELDRALPTEGARAILDDASFEVVMKRVTGLIGEREGGQS